MAGVLGLVLVVEDDVALQRLYERVLVMMDFGVLQANNGQEALQALNGELCPDLIMMDLSMPVMDGADLIRELRAHPKCSEVKILVVSGWHDLAARAKDLGADGYVRKPVELDHLQREVARLMQRA